MKWLRNWALGAGARAGSARRALAGATWEPCAPGCPGWFVTDCDVPLPLGWVHVQRCDECGRFADDDAAARYVSRFVRYCEGRARRRGPRVAVPWVSARIAR